MLSFYHREAVLIARRFSWTVQVTAEKTPGKKEPNLPIAIIVLVQLCFVSTSVFSEEQCVVHYDIERDVTRIPCVTVGEQKIWVNLRRAAANQLQFVVDAFGEEFLPLWLTQMIDDFENAPVANPPRSVTQYRYRDNVVYYVSSPCCDQFNNVYDTDGNLVCSPDGGLTGNGDGKCSDFFQESTNATLVWQDIRES